VKVRPQWPQLFYIARYPRDKVRVVEKSEKTCVVTRARQAKTVHPWGMPFSDTSTRPRNDAVSNQRKRLGADKPARISE
jgi:hypothetical protein